MSDLRVSGGFLPHCTVYLCLHFLIYWPQISSIDYSLWNIKMYLGTTLNVLSSLPLSRCRLVRLIPPRVNEMVCFLHIRQLIWPSHFHKIHGPACFSFSFYIIYSVNCTSPACYPDTSYSVALGLPCAMYKNHECFGWDYQCLPVTSDPESQERES